MVNEKLDVPHKETKDHLYWFAKQVINIIPCGSILSEILSEYLPSSFERRKEKWFREVANRLDELIEKDNNFIDSLKNNEEFISLLLETTQKALRTHLDEKINLYARILKNSILIDVSYYLKSIFIRYIEELHPVQILFMDYIYSNKDKLFQLDSFSDYYYLFEKENKVIDLTIDNMWFFLMDLEKRGLIYVSDNLNPPELKVAKTFESYNVKCENPILDQPYISINELGIKFLQMIKE